MKNSAFSHKQYIRAQSPEVRKALTSLYNIIRRAAPRAEEVISYGMPAFRYKGMLVYYAGFKNHYSLFPTSSAIRKYRPALTRYKCSAGTIQFEFGKKLPASLIKKIVRFRIQENEAKERMRASGRKKRYRCLFFCQ